MVLIARILHILHNVLRKVFYTSPILYLLVDDYSHR